MTYQCEREARIAPIFDIRVLPTLQDLEMVTKDAYKNWHLAEMKMIQTSSWDKLRRWYGHVYTPKPIQFLWKLWMFTVRDAHSTTKKASWLVYKPKTHNIRDCLLVGTMWGGNSHHKPLISLGCPWQWALPTLSISLSTLKTPSFPTPTLTRLLGSRMKLFASSYEDRRG